MKAISLKQPWATWVALGLKTIETRTWKTKHRGDLLICASKRVDKDAVELAVETGYPPYEKGAFPTGIAVAIVTVVDCRVMMPADTASALCSPTPGRYAWPLENIRPIYPFEVKGALSIFEINTDCVHCDGRGHNAEPIIQSMCRHCRGSGTKIQLLTEEEVAS